MITLSGSREIIYNMLQIVIIKEDSSSHSLRIAEAKGYHERRYEMASGVTEEERSPETLRFASDTKETLDNFNPALIPPKRWIGIGKFQIPFPPRRA